MKRLDPSEEEHSPDGSGHRLEAPDLSRIAGRPQPPRFTILAHVRRPAILLRRYAGAANPPWNIPFRLRDASPDRNSLTGAPPAANPGSASFSNTDDSNSA